MKTKYLANHNQMNGLQIGQIEKVAKAFSKVLDAMNFDWKRDPNMRDTPMRVAKMYTRELFQGCYNPEPKFTRFPNTKKYDEMIILRDIRIISTCSHHIQPFTGIAHIGYLPSPDGYICGVSKLARVLKWFAARPQIQEELTAQIAEFLFAKLNPLGLIITIQAQHGCMANRGVLEYNSKMVTSKVLGVFKDKPEARAEFFSLIGGK